MKTPSEEAIEALTDAIITQDLKMETAVKLLKHISREYSLDKATDLQIIRAIKLLGKTPPRNLQGVTK